MEGNAVYTGSWINWSKGSVQGATLTISSRNGTLLIAFLAVFVTWAGNQVWSIAAFAIHQYRSTTDARDTFHHQQQVLLRSGLNDVGFLWRLLKTAWSWKSTDKRMIKRTLPLLAYATLHLLIFFIAGLFTSRITSSTGEVLLKPNFCGWSPLNALDMIHFNFIGDVGPIDTFYAAGNWLYKLSKTYASTCYQLVSDDISLCSSFVKPAIPYKQNLSDSCPFSSEMCTTPTASFDSGLIDTHEDLGINMPKSDRMQFRKKLSCSLLPTEGKFSSNYTNNATEPFWPWDPPATGGLLYKYYYYGQQSIFGRNVPYTIYRSNMTSPTAYITFVMSAFMNDSTFSSFDPISELSRTNADVSLWAVNNQVQYMNPVHDPFFKATTKLQNNLFYTADNPLSFMGCTEQYQICNGPRCTELGGLNQTTPFLLKSIGFNNQQMALWDLIYKILFSTSLFGVIFLMQDSIFLAKDKVFGSYLISTGLPEQQWQMELANFFNLSLAATQTMAVIHASPKNIEVSTNKTYFDYIQLENTTDALSICRNQKIRSTGYYSFSILGLCVVLVGGSILIVLGHLVPNLVWMWRRRWPSSRGEYQTEEWKSGDVLQLQRVALEACGVMDWKDINNVPVSATITRRLKLPWLTEWSEQSFYIEPKYEESTYKVLRATPDLKAWKLLGL